MFYKRKMKVLGIGQAVIDKSILLREFPEEDSKVRPEEVKYSVGGPVPAALILLSRLGVECKLVARVGEDNYGSLIHTLLESESIRLIENTAPQTKENLVLVNVANASRTIIHSQIEHEFIKQLPIELIKEADLILFDRHEPLAFEYVLKHKRAETRVIVDTSTEISNKTLRMLKMADYPIVPLEVLEEVSKSYDRRKGLETLFATLGRPVIVTAGEAGSVYHDGKTTKLYPAYQAKSVDSLGAGDVYRGAFAYGVLQKWTISKTIDFANAVAALQCEKFGNGSAIPAKTEIENMIRKGNHQNIKLTQIIA